MGVIMNGNPEQPRYWKANDMKDAAPHRPTTRQLSMPVRLIYAALGLLSVGLGILGAILPGLPTTIFLIIASYLLTRSCPWLEEKIMGMAIFKPFLPFVRGERGMPRKAKITALVMMWTCVSISVHCRGHDRNGLYLQIVRSQRSLTTSVVSLYSASITDRHPQPIQRKTG